MPAVTRREWIALAAVLLVASALRLADLGGIPFGEDAAHMLQYADRLLHGEAVLTGIPSSKGVLNPPLAIYILAALRLVLRSPQALAAATALGGVAAVAITWWTTRRFFGPLPAIVAALFFAVSGWGVFYARAIWQQDFVPPLGALFLAALLFWTVERRAWALAAALALAGAASQLHMTCFAWFVVVGAVWLVTRAPLAKGPIAAGAAACALLYAPFVLAFVQRGTLQTNPGAAHAGALLRDFSGKIVYFTLASATHAGFGFQYREIGRAIDVLPFPLRALVAVGPWIAGALVVAGTVVCVRRARVETAARVLAIFAGLPIAAMVVSGLSAAPHYVIVIVPAVWILAALGVSQTPGFSGLRAVAAAATWAVVAGEVVFCVAWLRWVAVDPAHAGDEAPPLREQIAAMRWVAADSRGAAVDLRDAPDGAPVAANYPWLLGEAGGTPGTAGTSGTAAEYVVVYEGTPLTARARAALAEKGARRFGTLEVCRWR